MVLLIDNFTNKRGVFLKFTKLFNGTLRNIILPAGRFKWGCRRMKVYLDNLVGKRFWAPKGSSFQEGHHSEKTSSLNRKCHQRASNNGEKIQRSWRDVVGSRAEKHQDNLNKRNWRVAVLVFRFNISVSWSSIKVGLTKMLNVYHELSPLAADRAVLWCVNEIDRIKMENLGRFFIPDAGEVKFTRWNTKSQLNNSKIVCRNSWLGIEGVPLNLWNKHVFKVIGQKCGGLLDIARCTEELNCLTQAVVKLKGESGGFIKERMEIFCWGKKMMIKFVPSVLGDTRFHGARQWQGRLPKDEDVADVAFRTEDIDLTEGPSAISLSANSDMRLNVQSEGKLGLEQSGFATQEKYDGFGTKHIGNQLPAPQFTGSGSRVDQNLARDSTSKTPLYLFNSFNPLLSQPTCSKGLSSHQIQHVLGRAQDQDLEIKKPSGLRSQDVFPKPNSIYETRFKTDSVGTQPLLFNRAQSCDCSEARLLNKDGFTHYEGWALRAQSELGPHEVKLTGKLKYVKPKLRRDFCKGRICSWKNSGDSNTTPTLKKLDVQTSKDKKQELGNQKLQAIKALKVYSRIRSRRVPIIDLNKERKRVVTEEEFEDMDSDIHGDKPFLTRLDASSNSSSLDSKEVYQSDSAIEGDSDE